MFVIEIEFRDGGIEREVILVRRSLAVIGAQDTAHVVIEELRVLRDQLLLVRHLGRRFRIASLRGQLEQVDEERLHFTEYEGEAVLELGMVILRVIALDMDVALRVGEPADKAAVRVLREALSASHPLFPALVMKSGVTVVYSFAPEMPVLVGRARDCALRVDSSIISSNHARFGFEMGRFWVEDLGSTNGTYKKGNQIAGRVVLDVAEQVILGRDLTVAGIVSGDQIVQAASSTNHELEGKPTYPVLVSISDVVRPSRVALVLGVPIHLGRDPSSELWIGAPHVSRRHAVMQLQENGGVKVTNRSVNGLGYGEGVLQADESLVIDMKPMVFDFGGGVTVALCFGEPHETMFVDSKGSVAAFHGGGGRRAKQTMSLAKSTLHSGMGAAFEEELAKGEVPQGADSTTLHGEKVIDEVRRIRDGDDVVTRLRGLFGKLSTK